MDNHTLRTGRLSRLLAVAMAAALIITAVLPAAELNTYAATSTSTTASVSTKTTTSTSTATTTSDSKAKAKRVATTITGYKTIINKARSSKVKIKAKITPATGGRTVMLQRFSTKKNAWKTIMTLTTKDKETAKAVFEIPKKYRKRTSARWRIYVPDTDTAKGAVSKEIELTTRNIKNYSLSASAVCIYRIDNEKDVFDGTYIYSKDMSTRRAQASTTKLMTAVLLMESGKLNTRTKISAHAAATPWGSGHLAKGDIYKTHDLLYAMLLPSSNDAATAVAEKVGGTERKFVAMMNAKAEALGMTDTHFRNPHGLDASGHYTTAEELAMLTAYAYTFPEIRECWATSCKTIYTVKNKKRWTLWSTDSLINYISGFFGGKTGTTDNAGCCFAGVYQYNGKTYVTVVLGSGYGWSRWSDTQKLHQYIRKYADRKY